MPKKHYNEPKPYVEIRARSRNQQAYMNAIDENDVIFGIGPAGTGKTYLAVAVALEDLLAGDYKRVIFSRPAVTAAEDLGFLPGDLKEKIDPYLQPLYESAHKVIGKTYTDKLIAAGVIEVAPIAFLRGRTLDNAFIILDEAQNCTVQQMQLLLTRMGKNSKIVVCGDSRQCDLQNRSRDGLAYCLRRLDGVSGVAIYEFSYVDCVRHPLVKRFMRIFDGESATDQMQPASAEAQPDAEGFWVKRKRPPV